MNGVAMIGLELSEMSRAQDETELSYACPKTHAQLTLLEDRYLIGPSDEHYPIVNGIPQFLAYEPIETAETRAQLGQLIEALHRRGWESAISEVYGSSSRLHSYVTDPGRLKCLD